MSYLQPVKTQGTGSMPIFQTVLENAQGGFSLDSDGLTAGAIIPAGTPMTFDESTRKAKKATITAGTGDPVGPDTSDAKGLLYDDVVIQDSAPLSVVLRGTVYDRRVTPAIDAVHKAALPLIVFSESF